MAEQFNTFCIARIILGSYCTAVLIRYGIKEVQRIYELDNKAMQCALVRDYENHSKYLVEGTWCVFFACISVVAALALSLSTICSILSLINHG